MNWGYKILIVYGAFVAGILFMVFKSSTSKMDLVTTDYYAKELKYQDKIDEKGRTNALSEEVKYELADNKIIVHLPKDFAGKRVNGNIELYCPSNENKDKNKAFDSQDLNIELPIDAGNKGLHELHISWQVEGINYYFEKKIFI